jgi:hypothetical protein
MKYQNKFRILEKPLKSGVITEDEILRQGVYKILAIVPIQRLKELFFFDKKLIKDSLFENEEKEYEYTVSIEL